MLSFPRSTWPLCFPTADEVETQFWTCGYRGLCRRFCYAQEYVVGYHGCPRRYR
ncbi:beta-defensin [Arapaima gigas]